MTAERWRSERSTIKDKDGYTVATANTDARARLIAAAPDMLVVLKAIQARPDIATLEVVRQDITDIIDRVEGA